MRETLDILVRLLMRDGPQPAAALTRALGISQPTFSRLVRNAGVDVVVGGRSRQTRYAARRRVLGIAAEEAVFAIDDAGRVQRRGTLTPVYPGYLWTSSSPSSPPQWVPDLPWFLADLRPAGFLSRQLPARHPELELPDDVRLWSSDHVLRYVTRHGFDLPGNMVVGEAALRALHARVAGDIGEDVVDDDAYPRLAAQELAQGTPGSLAGGEQPKFLTRRRRGDLIVDVLVKFSPPTDTAVGRRVADLLLCEHWALQALSTTGLAAAQSRIVMAQGLVFLEVERFDRVPAPRGVLRGRRGVASLAALDDAFVKSDRHAWPSTTQALARLGLVDDAAVRAARIAWLFGQGIDNSDMHLGNFSFFIDGEFAPSPPAEARAGGFHLAAPTPVYDMLPMRHAPTAGQLVPRSGARPESFRAGVDDELLAIVEPAVRRFWASVGADVRIHDDLRRCADAWR